jgi:hypothetical protein
VPDLGPFEDAVDADGLEIDVTQDEHERGLLIVGAPGGYLLGSPPSLVGGLSVPV